MSFGFSFWPPEVLSGLIYTGPGAGPLLTAATAWTSLSQELTTTATSVQSQVTGLTGQWQGAGSTLMATATSPYIAWLETTAAQAAQMSAQATQAAALFETVHAGTVPPAVIAANRSLLLALIATNFFGQNTPAIMATEAQYEAMWAQDVAVNEAYAAGSEANNSVAQQSQPSPPPQPSNGPSQPVTNVQPAAAQNLATPHAAGDIGSTTSSWVTNAFNQLLSGATSMVGGNGGAGTGAAPNLSWIQYLSYGAMPLRYLTMLTSFARMGQMGSMGAAAAANAAGAAGAGPTALMSQIGDFVNDKMQGAVGTLVGHFNTATDAISAKLGQAASMGSLKVPQGWAAAADGMVRAAPVLPQTVSTPAHTVSATSGMPGGPFGNALMGALAGRGIGGVAAKAPKVIPRSPAGG